ncbi:NAD-dependent epimerase/dehydratase family protein [Tessaracoccus palaemonis]|uniref:NAD-dependent epimerase/dehydratase family protein n=1 Tax=Tessaracoccus palaemonis TaxID=2829499 RepID=A0ABX8SIX4_9ACTN|nr:NAD-dependent epimerase/dehydratase family protein [Tessaracoccus palaemonis]QXT63296.1 NAD-dependent epimerase/dehydratase family protein [Tessaracoccus palaemonis]
MTRVLILGGTGWLGAEIARGWVAAGADVTCLARGASGDVPEGARLVRADRREPGTYDALDGEWDEVVELSYEPDLVEPALRALADRARHWTLVSTVSVYARSDEPDADESAELVEPADLAQYPDAKVAAERATASRIGDRLLIARPGLIVGPGDPSDRFGYWMARLARGGRALAPVAVGRYVQVIDVADLACWVVEAGDRGLTGAFDVVGESVPMEEFFRAACEVAGFDPQDLVHVADEHLLARDVRYWAGPRSLPLWIPAEDTGFARRSGAAFRAAGGRVRPLAETLRRTLADEVARGVDRARRSGLTAAEEAAVLDALG